MQQFKVQRKEVENFSKVWRSKGGIVGTLNEHAIDFATDFANIVLRNFIDMCKQNVQAAQAVTQKPAPEPEKKLIVEA